MKDKKINIIIDTREQRPLDFSRFENIEVTTGTLTTGDYSIAGYENCFCIERKSLEDLIGTLNDGFEADTKKPLARFNRELMRMMRYQFKAILIDAHRDDLEGVDMKSRQYRSMTAPSSILGRLGHIWVTYQVPYVLVAPRPRAFYLTMCGTQSAAWEVAERESRQHAASWIVDISNHFVNSQIRWMRGSSSADYVATSDLEIESRSRTRCETRREVETEEL